MLSLAEAELARRSLRDFVELFWPVVEPAFPFQPSWHIDAICEHLEAVTRGDIKDLVINVPPGHGKSLIVAVLWPAWEWANDPQIRTMFASYSMPLSTRDSQRRRDLMVSVEYQTCMIPEERPWALVEDQNLKTWFKNTRKGEMIALSVAAKLSTGVRGHKLVVDDPITAEDAMSELAREKVKRWFGQTMSTRFNDPANRKRVLIMQRLHEDDLAGMCIEDGFEHLNLPSLYEPERHCKTRIGWEDPRTEEGELLCPERFPQEVIDKLRKDLGESGFSAQHQQSPAPDSGLMYLAQWLKYWRWPGTQFGPVKRRVSTGGEAKIMHQEVIDLPDLKRAGILMSVDCAFKGSEGSDRVAIHVWARVGARFILLDRDTRRMTFTETVAAIVAMAAKWPQATIKLVEDAANGPAVVDSLKMRVPGLVLVKPDGGKQARAHGNLPLWEAGNVFLPHPDMEPWVAEFIKEHLDFPRGKHDDDVDAGNQALKRLSKVVRRGRPVSGGARPGLKTR